MNNCWVGEPLEEVPFQETLLIEQFELYVNRMNSI